MRYVLPFSNTSERMNGRTEVSGRRSKASQPKSLWRTGTKTRFSAINAPANTYGIAPRNLGPIASNTNGHSTAGDLITTVPMRLDICTANDVSSTTGDAKTIHTAGSAI